MYPVSNAIKALFEADQRKVLRITGTDKNGASISITDNNVIADSFQIDRYCCNGEKLEIGTAIAAQMSFTLENGNGQYDSIVFEDAELFAEVGIADWTQSSPIITYVPCGYFTPDNQPRRLSTISITALDRMTLFDVEVDAADLTFPTTVGGLVGQVCVLCGVTLAQSISGLVNASVAVTELPTVQGKITYRNLIQWCAGIMGTNAWFDWNGQLRFSWYENATGYVSTVDNRYSSDLYEDDLTVSGIEYTNNSGIVIVEGTDDYAIDVTGNAIVGPLVATVLSPLNTALNGFTYRPFTAATVNAPYLWPMDIVTFTDKDGNDHTSALTNVAFGLNGTTAMESKGMTYAINKLAQPKGFTREQAQLITEVSNQIETDIDESLTQQEIFNRLTDNGAAQGLVLYNGQLYVNASYIQSGTLTLGGLNNVNGQLRVLNAAGNEVGKWDNSGLEVKEGTFNATAPGGYVAINAEVVPAIRRAFGVLWSPSTGDDVLVSIDRGELSVIAGGFDGYIIDDGHTNITPGEINIDGGIHNSNPGIIINGNADYSGGLSAESTTLYRNGQIRFTDYNGNTYFNLDYLTGMAIQGAVTAAGGFVGNVTGNCSGSAGSVAWGNVTGKPSTYTPESGSAYYLRRDTWWYSSDTHDANDLHGGITFAYATHGNTATNGTLIDFASSMDRYSTQLQGDYSNNNLYFRNNNSNDGGGWGAWRKVVYDSGTWGISITGNAGTATKATQDGSGNTIASTYLKLSGGTLTGNIYVEAAGERAIAAQNSTVGTRVYLLSSNPNHGVYSNGYYNGSSFVSGSKWMVYRSTDGVVYLNGNALGNAANVTGTVAVGHGGTGATSAANARTNLGVYSGTVSITSDSNGDATITSSTISINFKPSVFVATPCTSATTGYYISYNEDSSTTSAIKLKVYSGTTKVAVSSLRINYIAIS